MEREKRGSWDAGDQCQHEARWRPLMVRSLGPHVAEGTHYHWHALDGLPRRKPCTTAV